MKNLKVIAAVVSGLVFFAGHVKAQTKNPLYRPPQPEQVAADAARQKIVEPIVEAEANPNKDAAKFETKYDYVQDITRVNGRSIYFRIGEKEVTDEGHDFSFSTELSFDYIFDGEQPKKPLAVIVRIYTWGAIQPFETCYWRFGNSKLSFDVDAHFSSSKYSNSVVATAILPLQTFLNWSKLPEIYMKLGNEDRVYHIASEFLAPMKEVADSIPTTGETSKIAPPKPDKKKDTTAPSQAKE